MITMAKLARWKGFPFHIVFAIGRGDDNVLRLRAFKQHAFERRQSRAVQMLDDFDDGAAASKPAIG